MKVSEKTFRKELEEVRERLHRTPSQVPAWRSAFREKYSFSNRSFEEQLAVWDYIWKHSDDGYPVRIQPHFFYETFLRKDDLLISSWEVLQHWQHKVDDWGYCDSLSKVYTRQLELIPDKVYKTLENWNQDENLWKRRQSIVSLLYYSRTKSVFLPFKKIIRLVNPLLDDPEYYVQKGVGWTLREVHNVYPEETDAFVDKNIRSVSAIAFSAATEKVNKKRKEEWKLKRK